MSEDGFRDEPRLWPPRYTPFSIQELRIMSRHERFRHASKLSADEITRQREVIARHHPQWNEVQVRLLWEWLAYSDENWLNWVQSMIEGGYLSAEQAHEVMKTVEVMKPDEKEKYL